MLFQIRKNFVTSFGSKDIVTIVHSYLLLLGSQHSSCTVIINIMCCLKHYVLKRLLRYDSNRPLRPRKSVSWEFLCDRLTAEQFIKAHTCICIIISSKAWHLMASILIIKDLVVCFLQVIHFAFVCTQLVYTNFTATQNISFMDNYLVLPWHHLHFRHETSLMSSCSFMHASNN